jgi:hypothetical protein
VFTKLTLQHHYDPAYLRYDWHHNTTKRLRPKPFECFDRIPNRLDVEGNNCLQSVRPRQVPRVVSPQPFASTRLHTCDTERDKEMTSTMSVQPCNWS